MSNFDCCVFFLDYFDLLFALRCFGSVNTASTELLTRLFNPCLWFVFLAASRFFGVLLQLAVGVFLLGDSGDSGAGFTGIFTLSALEKLELTDEKMLSSSTGGLRLIHLPPSTFL